MPPPPPTLQTRPLWLRNSQCSCQIKPQDFDLFPEASPFSPSPVSSHYKLLSLFPLSTYQSLRLLPSLIKLPGFHLKGASFISLYLPSSFSSLFLVRTHQLGQLGRGGESKEGANAMSPAPIDALLPEPPLPPRKRFSDLRSVRWRIDLGVLPSSLSASIEDLRRITADSRRR